MGYRWHNAGIAAALVVALAACQPAEQDSGSSASQQMQSMLEPEQESGPMTPEPPPMMLEGAAGSPSGPGVEPPSTPTPEPPDNDRTAGEPTASPAPAVPAAEDQEVPAQTGVGNFGDASMTPEPGCVLATRLDTCCMETVAATPAEVAADSCLVAYDRNQDYPSSQVEACQAPLGLQCALVRCAAPRAPSSQVALDATGACAFVDECQSAEDCVVASDLQSACACPGVWPLSVVNQEPCLIIEGEAAPAQCPVPQNESCTCPAPTAPQCVDEDGLQVCR